MRIVFNIIVLTILALPTLAFADTKKDTADCAQTNDHARQLGGCTRIINTPGLPVQNRLIAHNNLANALLRIGDLDKALAECTEALRLDPRQMWGHYCRGAAFMQKGEFDQAILNYTEAYRVDPKSGIALAARGRVYLEKGDIDRALADVNAGIKVNSTDYVSFLIRASIDIKADGVDAAIADANEAIRLKPDYAQSYAQRGSYWRRKGNLDRAIADQDKAIELEPKSALNRTLRSVTERYKNDFKAALIDADEALKLEPDFVPAFVSRGLAFEKMGDLSRARTEYQRALDSTSVRRHAGLSVGSIETAKARLAALDSGAPQPVIPAAPVRSGSSIPTPAVLAPAVVAQGQTDVRRAALVIGNSAYSNVPTLLNPQHDAEAIADSLRAIGFSSVTLVQNATRESLIDALHKFGEEAEKSDWAMIYYAGHGIEVNGINYLIPIDAKLSTDRDVQHEAVPMDQAMSSLDGAKKLKLIMLDACRDNPFTPQMRRTAAALPVETRPTTGAMVGTRSIGRGLGEVKVSGATLVVYAAKQGEVALDGDSGNSPFAVAVIQRIATPNVEINKLFRLIRDDVMEATGGRQEPYTYGSLPGREDFFFVTK